MSFTPAQKSYQFYVALDAIEQCFDYVEKTNPARRGECVWFRNELERVADVVLEIAAEHGWARACTDSGFREFQSDYEDFMYAACYRER